MNKYNINKGDLLFVDNILFRVLAIESDQIKVAVIAGHSNSSKSYSASSPSAAILLNTGEHVLDYNSSNINTYLQDTVFTAFSQNIQDAAVAKPFTCYIVHYPDVPLGTDNYLTYSYYQDTNMMISKTYTLGSSYTISSRKIRGACIQDIVDYYDKDSLDISAHEIGQLFSDPSFVDFSPTGYLSDYWLVDSVYNSNYDTSGGTYMTGLYLDGNSYLVNNNWEYTWLLSQSTSYAYAFPIMWLDLTKLTSWINATMKLKCGTFTFNTAAPSTSITGSRFESNGKEFSKLYCSGNNVFYDTTQVRNSSGWVNANYRTIHIPARSDLFVNGTFSSINTFLKSGSFGGDNKIGISLLELLPNISTSNLKVKVLKTGEADQNLTSLLSAPITYDCGKAGYEYVSNITNGSLQAVPKLKTGQSHDTEVQANAGYFPPNDLSVYDITGSTKITSSYNTVTPPGSWAYDKFNGKVALYSALGSAQFKGDCVSADTYTPVELGSGVASPELWYYIAPDTASSSGYLSNWDSKISKLGTDGVSAKIIIADKLYDKVYYKAHSWTNTYLGTKLNVYSKQLMAKSTATGAEIALAWMNQAEEWDSDAWKKVTRYYKNNDGHALIFLDPANDAFYTSEAWEAFKLYFAPTQSTLTESTIKFNLTEISYADFGCEIYAISYNKDADKVYKIPLRARSIQESVVATGVWSLAATSEDTEYYYNFYSWIDPLPEESWFPKAIDYSSGGEDGINAIRYYAPVTDLTITSVNLSQGSCLTKGTLITLADNTQKPIEDIVVGDEVLGYNWESSIIESQLVTRINKWECKAESYDLWTFDDGTTVGTANPHEFYNVEKGGFEYLANWNIGEHTYKIDGTTPRLVSHEVVQTPIQYYRITTNNQTNYFANNLLSGNRACPKGLTVDLLNKGNILLDAQEE